jgi:hypothetical protein
MASPQPAKPKMQKTGGVSINKFWTGFLNPARASQTHPPLGQKGFFDVERRLEAISAKGDPLCHHDLAGRRRDQPETGSPG